MRKGKKGQANEGEIGIKRTHGELQQRKHRKYFPAHGSFIVEFGDDSLFCTRICYCFVYIYVGKDLTTRNPHKIYFDEINFLRLAGHWLFI